MQYSWFKIHIIVKLALNHFNIKLYYFRILPKVLQLLHITAQAPYFKKIQIQIFFLTSTINKIAQNTTVFSTISHLLFRNRCQFFSHFLTFLMVIGAIRPIQTTKCLTIGLKCYQHASLLIQTLVSQLIGTNKQSIKSS